MLNKFDECKFTIFILIFENGTVWKACKWNIWSIFQKEIIGNIYKGKVVNIKDFGAFVNILPGVDGMLHISQISEKRLDKVEDALHLGDEVKVRLEAIDDKGRLSLSMRRVEQ